MKGSKINILFISHYSEMYGANRSLYTLVQELKENHDVNPVVLLRKYGPICNFLDESRIKYYVSHYFWWVYQGNSIQTAFLNFIKQFRNVNRIIRIYGILKNEHINLVYTNGLPVNIGVILKYLFNCPHIWHIRESIPQFDFKFSIGKFLSKRIMKNGANKFILISDFLINSYSHFLPEKKVFRIYNGISLKNVTDRNNTVTKDLNICILGIVTWQKNQMDCIKALNLIVNTEQIKKIKLHIIGTIIPEYHKELQNYIIKHRLTNHVLFYDHQLKVEQLLQEMNLGIICSEGEPFGRVTIEYMLHKLPVIASNSGANPEIMKEGISGFLYELFNEKDLANKILHFIEHPELIHLMGEKAYEHARQNFSSERNTKEIYQVIETLLNISGQKSILSC